MVSWSICSMFDLSGAQTTLEQPNNNDVTDEEWLKLNSAETKIVLLIKRCLTWSRWVGSFHSQVELFLMVCVSGKKHTLAYYTVTWKRKHSLLYLCYWTKIKPKCRRSLTASIRKERVSSCWSNALDPSIVSKCEHLYEGRSFGKTSAMILKKQLL